MFFYLKKMLFWIVRIGPVDGTHLLSNIPSFFVFAVYTTVLSLRLAQSMLVLR